MAFTIPDESSAGHADQAEPKTLDFQALARRDTGVASGCAVTAQSIPDMTVAVASGSVRVAGVSHAVTGGNVTITANATANPRYDAVVSDSSGVLSAIAGTAAPETTLDQPGVDVGTYAVLAIVYVGPGVTEIDSADITDKRISQNPDSFHPFAHALNDTNAHTGAIDDTQIPAGIARDSEVTTAVSDHSAASDPHGDRAAAASADTTAISTHAGLANPHTVYQLAAGKGVASGYASLDSNALVPATQLPNPSASLLGGVKSKAATTHQFLTSIGTDGVPVAAAPVSADISDLLTGAVAFTGDISPTALSANVNDYNPTGLSTAAVIRLSTNDTTPRAISGIAGGADGRILMLRNLGPGNVVLLDQSTSTASNQFALSAGNLTLIPNGAVEVQYDATTSFWYAVRPSTTVDAVFSKQGAVATTTESTALRWYNDTGRTLNIVSIRASAVTAPTGATLIVDVNKDGTTIFTTQGNRPAIAISGNTIQVTNPDVTTIATGSYLSVNIDQVGSTVAGSDLTVQVFMRTS